MSFTLQIGEPAPHFSLCGVDGRDYSLNHFDDAKLLVIVFSCNHCPYVIGSEDRMIQLDRDYRNSGVQLVAINSNETDNHPTDDYEHMVQRAREKGFEFPYLRDDTQQVARAYGALRTPHFFLFDRQRLLRYTGRMDDNPREPQKATTRELRDAIDALLEDQPVPIDVTNPIGCNVKWAGQDEHWMPAEACDLV
jgi:peroxiredoxin